MHDSITWIGMDVHKESIVVTAVGDDPECIRAHCIGVKPRRYPAKKPNRLTMEDQMPRKP